MSHTEVTLTTSSTEIWQYCPVLHTPFQVGNKVVLCKQSGTAFSLKAWEEYASLWEDGCPYCAEPVVLLVKSIVDYVNFRLDPPRNLRIGPPRVLKNGRWANVLMWEQSQSSKVKYLVIRKYDSTPKSHTDGEQRGVVVDTYFLDEEPETNRMVHYAVFACKDSEISGDSARNFADSRIPDVINLTAIKETATRIRLNWHPPEGVYDIIVRRSYDQAPRTHRQGINISVVDHSGAVDNEASPNQDVAYTVFCRFLQKNSFNMRVSTGCSIRVYK